MHRNTSIFFYIFILFLILTVSVNAEAKIIDVSAGAWHSLALDDNGTIIGWGYNNMGELGEASAIDNKIFFPVVITDISNVTKISAGSGFSAAIGRDGSIYTWGLDLSGQLGDGGIYGTLHRVPTRVLGLNNVSMVKTSNTNTIALCKNGSVWIWGLNDLGQIGDGTKIDRNIPFQVNGTPYAIDIASGDRFALIVASNGSVWSWGYNAIGTLGDGTREFRNIPVRVNNLTDIVSIEAGNNHFIALARDGTVWACGDDNWGQLGDGASHGSHGTATDSLIPKKVTNLTSVKAIAAGGYHNIVLKDDGTVWVWGDNSLGQLGVGNTLDYSTTPVQVPGLSNIKKISASEFDTIVLSDNGTMWGWGDNVYGQLGFKLSSLNNISYISSPLQIPIITHEDINATVTASISSNNTPKPSHINYDTNIDMSKILALVILVFIICGAVFYYKFKNN